jgi:YHS domain-containing protein
VNEFVKCNLCNKEICEPEKCVFTTTERTIGGKEYYFCCEAYAVEFEKRIKKKSC